MKAIKRYFNRRKARRLAERILAHQIAYSNQELESETVDNAIRTAIIFHERWKELAK